MNFNTIIAKLDKVGDKIIDGINGLNNKQLSFIITSCLMGIIILTIFNIRMAGQQEEEFLYELSFDEELLEEVPMEEEVVMEELETHQAYNEAMESKYSQELEDFKTLEELAQEAQEAASENPENSELNDLSLDNTYAKEMAEKLREQREKIKSLNKEDDAPKPNIKRRTTITYSLLDRTHIKLANPVYTCQSFGKVVINIIVDSNGFVTDASHNRNSSNTSNACLVENAIKYALRSRFAAKSTAEQRGTITYLFQGE
ncbi:hypothetical protein OOZ15_14095 [Galbibacter sp. EGI 63066]|uniref:hypothetical protein n=1 Tax=Galbibacter sp. EGI 63066 TaxID=2993559 RepID=UPI002248B5DD|nr:hypothetical protein [Galbibacter sp. EGI 63066]MCX2681079.1 hypothetical protein [Galbibacter sp. EGI 63066]